MTRFNWRTEDEEAIWEDKPKPAGAPAARRQRWLALALLICLAGLAGWIGHRHLQQRADETVALLREEALSSHRLAEQAAAQGDVELFHAFLSGRDYRWTESQLELVGRGAYFDRSQFGLEEPAIEAEVVRVDFSADLSEATIVTRRPYTLSALDGFGERVFLEQTALYRRGEQRWLLAPPEPDFWQGWILYNARHVSLSYPERDREMAERLLASLDAAVTQLCQSEYGANCPPHYRVRVRFDHDPLALLRFTRVDAYQTQLSAGELLLLPAPTLVGLPTDEAGYQALARAYTIHVLSAIMADLVGWSCCDQERLHTILIDRQLDRMGLLPWPVTADYYRPMVKDPIYLYDFFEHWDRPLLTEVKPDNVWQAYLLVEFVDHYLARVSPAVVQQELIQAANLWDWLRRVTLERPNNADLEQAWLRFAYKRLAELQTVASPPHPDYDVAFLCQHRAPGYRLHYYNFQTNGWQTLAGRYDGATPLPGSQALILHIHETAEQGMTARLQLWRQGEPVVLVERRDARFLLSYASPDERQIAYLQRSVSATDYQWFLLDLDQCEQDCAPEPLVGRPTWSPDGRYMIVEEAGSLWLHERGRQQVTLLAQGAEPFWLEEEKVGYLLPNGRTVVALDLADPAAAPQPLLNWSDILTATPDPTRLSQFSIQEIASSPAADGPLFLASYDLERPRPGNTFLYYLDRPDGELSLVRQTIRFFLQDLTFSPDGRWLTMGGHHPLAASYFLYLHDTQDEASQVIAARAWPAVATYAWSPDGRWLARADLDFLHFIAAQPDPETAELWQQVVSHDMGHCADVIWLAPGALP